MGASVVIIAFLPWLDRSPVKSIRYRGPIYKSFLTALRHLLLHPRLPRHAAAVAGRPAGFADLQRRSTFAFFLLMPWYSKIDKCKPEPERVTFK